MLFQRWKHFLWLTLSVIGLQSSALAIPDFVEHVPANAVYGESGVTMRNPSAPREGEEITIWTRIGYSFYYTDVAIYYTTDGSIPSGSRGIPTGTTQVLRSSAGQIQFVRNEPSGPGNIDWWRATLPANTRTYGQQIRYKIGSWHSGGGDEIFSNNYGCSDGQCDNPSAPATVYSYQVKLAWPGRGSPHVNPDAGYPNTHLWKEEGVVGNNFMNVMIDQNGSVFDIYYPSAGCVQGMGTKNEGYVDGLDTFPPGLPPGFRGQMNTNIAMGGIRVDGRTYWLTNEAGGDYTGQQQSYIPDTNVISTFSRLVANGNNIEVFQYDFCPKGISFPHDQGGQPNPGIYVKRFVLINRSNVPKTINFYYYGDFALNGGDSYDVMFADPNRGAMVAYDNTFRQTSSSGEYNPTSFNNYDKNVSIYLAAAMKVCNSVGSASGTAANDFWRDSSSDNDQGWIGARVVLPVNQAVEINVVIVGGFDNFANTTGTYNFQVAPVLDWFLNNSMASMQSATQDYWIDWLSSGVLAEFPDARYNELFRRGLLGTALHVDEKGGGVIAGMHNGAYPFVWPRDAAYAAVTLARTGHTQEATDVFRFLSDVAYRANEEPGRKGFWYQKYTTDGYIVWSAPQVDETSVVPWALYYLYNVTGNLGLLSSNYQIVYEAARASSEDSNIDSRLYYADPFDLMYSNNVWEDAFDTFIYSNASVERGLRDAATIATLLGNHGDASLFNQRANAIHSGVIARLQWDGENTDISQLGLVNPFKVFSPIDSLVAHVVDRINGVATDRYGNNHPLVNFGGEWDGLINRYWGDTYWNGGPWFLTTVWYGLYYADRANHTPGKGDINIHKNKLDLLIDRLGPIGFGAEQIAPSNSLLYPGQTDFVLQAAWPNAWESMSILTDALMAFLDFTPDAPNNTLRIAPKLPTGWNQFEFRNLPVGAHRLNALVQEGTRRETHTFRNLTGNAVQFETYFRMPVGARPLAVLKDGNPIPFAHDPQAQRVRVQNALNVGANALTEVQLIYTSQQGDVDGDGCVNDEDLLVVLFTFGIAGSNLPADINQDGRVDDEDLLIVLFNFGAGC